MDYRGLVVLGACLIAATVPLLHACKGPDPGAITFEERPGAGDDDDTTSGATTTTPGTDGGAGGAADAGAAMFPEPFTFEEPQRVNNLDPVPTGHVDGNAPPMNGKTCVQAGCHADAPKWGAAGTIYGSKDGATPFPAALKGKIQIRIATADNKEYGTFYPDEDGNFYLTAPGDAFPPAGSHVAIRTDTGAIFTMTGTIEGVAGANCNAAGCHDSGTKNRLVAQ
jgi:hypothetical protein